MALIFPANPVIGDVFGNWQWDGAKWIAVAVVGGGIAGDDIGVADGSDAVPGHIGEYLYNAIMSGTVANNTTAQPVSLELSAGDWDVSCLLNIVFTLTSPASVYQTTPGSMAVRIDGSPLVGMTAPALTGYNLGTSTYNSLSFGTFFGPVRVNVAEPMTADIVINPVIFAETSPGVISLAAIWARRMR